MEITYKDGVHEISNEEYHASSAISRSKLHAFKVSPLNYYYKFVDDDAPPFKVTDELILGSYVHALVLEPDTIKRDFVSFEKVDRRTTIGKKKHAEIELYMSADENKHKHLIDDVSIATAHAMADALEKEELFLKLIDGAQIEKSIFFTHKSTGLQCRARPDAWSNKIVVDLKTTNDASFRGFQSSCLKYGYFLQAGMINEALKSLGIEMSDFVVPCVESKPPYQTAIYMFDEEAIAYGASLFNDLMERFAKCLESNKWESYGYQTMSVPNYAFYE